MLKFVQLNPLIHHHLIPIMLHLHLLLVIKKEIKKEIFILIIFLIGQARRFKKLCEEIQSLFLTSKERLAKQRRPHPPPSQQQHTHENRSLTNSSGNTNATTSLPLNSNTPMTPRSNASFISSLFSNTNSSCKTSTFFFIKSLENKTSILILMFLFYIV